MVEPDRKPTSLRGVCACKPCPWNPGLPPMSSTEFSVEIDHVSKRFGDFVAVDDVSLTVRRGEFFSLLGPSGCGKTTLLRMIGGFELPTAGAIRVNGVDMTEVPVHKRPINMVFQAYALFPHLTVAENISFGFRYKNYPARRVRAAHRQGGGARPARRLRGPLSLPALRRPAPARRARPGAGARAAGAAARRAAGRPRPEAAQGGAGRAQEPAAQARHHLRLRHPRPGRGAHHERPHRGDERRPRRAAGQPRRRSSSIRRPSSWRSSWARRTSSPPPCAASPRASSRSACRTATASPCRIPARLAKGEEVRFVVRPEKLDLRSRDLSSHGIPCMPVTIEDRVYQGVSTVWVVRERRRRALRHLRAERAAVRGARQVRRRRHRLPVLEPASHGAHAADPAETRIPPQRRPACLRRSGSGRGARLAAYLQVLPTWVVLGIFFVLPLVIMLVISFGQRGTYGGLKPIEDLVGLRRLRRTSSPTTGARSSRSTSRSTGARCGWRSSPRCSAWW